MQKIPKAIAHILVEARILFAAVALGLTVFFGWYALHINFDFSPDTIFIEDDPAYIFYKDVYLPQFSYLGTPAILAISAKDPDKDLTKAITVAANKLAHNHYVNHVMSPHDQRIYIPSPEGIVPIDTLDSHGHLTKLAIDYFKSHPLYQGTFISKKTNAMALAFTLNLPFKNQKLQEEAVLSINHDINELSRKLPGVTIQVTGLPFIQHEMVSLLRSDQTLFIPLVAIFMIALLLLMTKHPLGALFPLLVIFLALIWTVGYLSLRGHEINVVNNAIVILMMVIGIADAVHIYTRFIDESVIERKEQKNQGLQKSVIIKRTLSAMLLPCFLTSATTALGFAASSAAGVEIIKQFGMDAAVGVSFCFLASFMVMPLLLFMHPIPRGHDASWLRFWPKRLSIDRLLRFSIGMSLRYALTLTASAIILIAAAIFIGRGITANQTWVGELPKNNSASVALSFIETNFSGVMPFYLVLSGDPAKLTSFETAKATTTIVNQLRGQPLSPTIRSPFDPIVFFLEKSPHPLQLDQIDNETYNELLAIVSTQKTTDIFFSKDKHYMRLPGFLRNAPTDAVERFREDLERQLKSFNVEGVTIVPTGPALISSRALHNITKDMAYSIGLAILYISLFIAIFFRSIRYTLVAIIPNVLPIALTIAGMHLLGIELRLATVMIFSMALGLSIDTCIHLLCRVKEESQKIKDRYQRFALIRSIHHAFSGSGRPIIYTTIILLGGFFAMMMSQFMALRDFAFISVIVLLSALIADIVLLPALLLVTDRAFIRKK